MRLQTLLLLCCSLVVTLALPSLTPRANAGEPNNPSGPSKGEQYEQRWNKHQERVRDELQPEEVWEYFNCANDRIAAAGDPAYDDPESIEVREKCLEDVLASRQGQETTAENEPGGQQEGGQNIDGVNKFVGSAGEVMKDGAIGGGALGAARWLWNLGQGGSAPGVWSGA